MKHVSEPRTMEEMCQTISFYMMQAFGISVTPHEIFVYSPSGELSLVFELYYKATGAVLNHEKYRYEWPDTFDDWTVPE